MTEQTPQNPEQFLALLQKLAFAVLSKWGIEGRELALIKYRENAVYKVVTGDGKLFALRIHRGGYHTDAEVRSELTWMAALQEHGIDVPTVVPTAAGELFVTAAVDGLPGPLQVDLFEWVEGVQLGSAEKGLGEHAVSVEETYRTIGRIAAQLHNHASLWQLPTGFHMHSWDVDGLVGDNPYWGRFWELEALTSAQRELLLSAREMVRRDLTDLSRSPEHADCYGLIHADFVPDNLLVAEDRIRLIDFDDAGFGWHLFELATALFFLQEDPSFVVARDGLIAGYRECRPLSEAMLEKLPLFMVARGFTYLGWVHTRQGTQAAAELTPYLTGAVTKLAEDYLYRR